MAPLYQDYTVGEDGSEAREDRIRAALSDAGWELAAESTPPAIATRPRMHRHWGLYRVTVAVEVLPMGQEHVRVLIHPYREYVWGGRTKLPFLTHSIRRAFLRELDQAFERHGFAVYIDG